MDLQRVMMMPFLTHDPRSLPDGLGWWKPYVAKLCAAMGARERQMGYRP